MLGYHNLIQGQITTINLNKCRCQAPETIDLGMAGKPAYQFATARPNACQLAARQCLDGGHSLKQSKYISIKIKAKPFRQSLIQITML